MTSSDFDGLQLDISPPANDGELVRIKELAACGFAVLGDYQTTIVDWVSRPQVVTLIARQSNRVNGFITYTYLRDGTEIRGELIALAVDAQDRHQGIGRHLMARAIDALTRGSAGVGAKDIYLTVATDNRSAKSLFEGLGFSSCGVDQAYPNGQDSMRMKLAT
jgi:ribosomal protein S18 acetylase RimI-like enzyme